MQINLSLFHLKELYLLAKRAKAKGYPCTKRLFRWYYNVLWLNKYLIPSLSYSSCAPVSIIYGESKVTYHTCICIVFPVCENLYYSVSRVKHYAVFPHSGQPTA